MPFDLSNFHFIRPELLLLLIPAIGLVYFAKQRANQKSSWQKVISPHLLEFLFVKGEKQSGSKFPFWLTTILLSLLIIAISGPSYRQKAVPVFESENAQVILVDLSLSMDATDIKPSRLERARFKLIDLLNRTKEGTIGLVVYAGDAFVISPLTSDSNTISNMVPTLSTQIMPVLGSRPDVGMDKAIELLKNAKHSRGQIIWLTDGVESDQITPIVDSVRQSGYQLSILAIGTEQGAPIPLPNGSGFLKDKSGSIVVPKLDLGSLKEIADSLEAGFVRLTPDQSDIDYLQAHLAWQNENADSPENQDQRISKWIDDGYWMIWLVLLLFIFKLIRQPSGSFASIGLLILFTTGSLVSQPVHATEEESAEKIGSSAQREPKSELSQFWSDLWATRDQQAQSAYREGDYQTASELFENREWKATSEFKSGDFSEAAKNFSNPISETEMYNKATSLAKAQQLQESLDLYNELLARNPEHEDAAYNKKIVEEMLQQQQEQNQQDQQSDEDKQNEQSKDSESNDNNQQQQDQNSDEQKKQEQQQESEQQSQQEQESQQQKQEAEMSEDERNKSEKDQALEHWLEKIPDDPGGLLRRKMYREYQRRGRQQKEEKLW